MESKYEQMTDEYLAQLAQEGSIDAEEFLIRKYKDLVRGRARLYFIMGADGDDVVQEGMIGIFKAIRSYDKTRDASFHTFAGLCIDHQITTAIKTASRLKHSPLNTSISLNKPVSDDDLGETLLETLSTGSNSDPEALLVLKDIVENILSNDNRIFSDFEMKVWNEYLQGKGYRQIADEMGKPTKAVDNAMQRTKKKIFAYISQ